MVAIHFTTIPREPNTCIPKYKEILFYAVFVPVRLCARFEYFRTVLYVFMGGFFFKFPCAEN